MQSTSTAKTSVPTDSDGNACVFSQTITNQTLDWVSLYPGRPVRPYAEELALCQRYAAVYRVKNGNTLLFPGYGMSETSFRFTAQLPTPMRTKPTVTGTSLTAGASAPNEQAHNLSGVTVVADAGKYADGPRYHQRADGGKIVFPAHSQRRVHAAGRRNLLINKVDGCFDF